MKKFLVAAVVVAVLAGVGINTADAAQTYQKSDLTAFFLSAYLPGVGEWYNTDFDGGFPLVECVTGAICPCIRLSSILDATAGDTSVDNIRIDFWSAPSRQ